MSVESRIRTLTQQHSKLETAILDEQKRPAADPTKLRQLKRKKLQIKEEIGALRA